MKWKFKYWLYPQNPNRLRDGQISIYNATGNVPISLRLESYHEGKRIQVSTGISCSPELLYTLYPEFKRSKTGIDFNKTNAARIDYKDIYSALESFIHPYKQCVEELNINPEKYQHVKTRKQFKLFKEERLNEIAITKKVDGEHKLLDFVDIYLKVRGVTNESTASNYKTNIKHFCNYANNEDLTIWDIDYKWLKKWDKWAGDNISAKSIETYGNHLKIILEFAETVIPDYTNVPITNKKKKLSNKQIQAIMKSFGTGNLVLPETNQYVVRKAPKSSFKPNRYLDSEQIEVLKKYWKADNGKTLNQQKALDIWFLMYYLAGCYPMDLVRQFKKENYHKEKLHLEYVRHKTKDTTVSVEAIPIKLNDVVVELIEKYKSTHSKNLFNFIETANVPENEYKLLGDRNSGYLRIIGKKLGFKNLNCSMARHSCFNELQNKGEAIEKIQRIAGHSDLSVTRGYLDSLKIVDLTETYAKL
mgnify:FL=1